MAHAGSSAAGSHRFFLWVAGLLFTLAITCVGFLPSQRPPIVDAGTGVDRAVAATRPLTTGHIPSFWLQETTVSWPANSGITGLASYRGAARSTSTWWYASPKRWRVSGRYLVPPRVPGMRGGGILGGTSFEPVPGTVVSDGRDIWRYYQQDRQVQVERILPWDAITQFSFPVGIAPFGLPPGNLPTLLAHPHSGCYGPPTVKGSATIAGRQVSIVDLGPGLCVRGSGSSGTVAGRAMIWVDTQTDFVLQYRLFDPNNSSKLLSQTTVTSVRCHAAIGPRLLRFTPPAGTVIDDMRQRAVTAARPYNRALARAARRLAFPLLAPDERPAGLAWSTPRLLAPGHLVLAFLPPGSRAGPTAGGRVTVVERRATAADLERPAPGAERVAVDGAAGWYVVTPAGHRFGLVREGTAIVLSSRALGRDALIALASVIEPVAGGHEPLGVPGMSILRAARLDLSFPVFVPTRLPTGLKLTSIREGDGRKNPPNSVEIDYGGRRGPARIFQSFAGCCIDQDLRKWVDPFRLPGGVIAFRYGVQPRLGGPLLWWDQAGTYIGLTGPHLTRKERVEIAGSMSRTAMPAGEAFVPSPRGQRGVAGREWHRAMRATAR